MAVAVFFDKVIEMVVAVLLDKIAIMIHVQVAIVVTVIIVNGCISLLEIGIKTITDMFRIHIMQVKIQMRIWIMADAGTIIVAIQIIVTTMIGISRTTCFRPSAQPLPLIRPLLFYLSCIK